MEIVRYTEAHIEAVVAFERQLRQEEPDFSGRLTTRMSPPFVKAFMIRGLPIPFRCSHVTACALSAALIPH